MSTEATFRTSSGGDPVQYILSLKQGLLPTEGDCLYAAQRQRTRILERTFNGVDVDGQAFEAYSTDGPYYYSPNGRIGNSKFTVKQNKAAVKYLLKRLGPVLETRSEYGGYEGLGGVASRSGQSIRFESYADFKASLGRAGVDLTGPRAPHMLQSIAIKVNGTDYGITDTSTGLTGRRGESTQFVLGIYGDPAGRATGHNTGINPRWKRNHRRHFFGASVGDIQAILSDLASRVMARMKGAG